LRLARAGGPRSALCTSPALRGGAPPRLQMPTSAYRVRRRSDGDCVTPRLHLLLVYSAPRHDQLLGSYSASAELPPDSRLHLVRSFPHHSCARPPPSCRRTATSIPAMAGAPVRTLASVTIFIQYQCSSNNNIFQKQYPDRRFSPTTVAAWL
jgi:hypothetical protein